MDSSTVVLQSLPRTTSRRSTWTLPRQRFSGSLCRRADDLVTRTANASCNHLGPATAGITVTTDGPRPGWLPPRLGGQAMVALASYGSSRLKPRPHVGLCLSFSHQSIGHTAVIPIRSLCSVRSPSARPTNNVGPRPAVDIPTPRGWRTPKLDCPAGAGSIADGRLKIIRSRDQQRRTTDNDDLFDRRRVGSVCRPLADSVDRRWTRWR